MNMYQKVTSESKVESFLKKVAEGIVDRALFALYCTPAVLMVFVLEALQLLIVAWVSSVMWGWYVVPTFHLPTLSISAAVGLLLLLRILNLRNELSGTATEAEKAILTMAKRTFPEQEIKSGPSPKAPSPAVVGFFNKFGLPLLCLLIGWLLK